ncbi:FlgD immunoglobulin-like domain containing protein [Candidatus Latescibacterota bacterium]
MGGLLKCLRFSMHMETHIEFVVYDVLGRKVKVLEDGMREAGAHEVVWDGKDEKGAGVGSGMYFYQVKMGEDVKKGKMVLVR